MNTLNYYVWLVQTLIKRHGATKEELKEEWQDCELNFDHAELNDRTLGRWKNAAEELFGIIIECSPAQGYRYFISNEEELKNNSVASWLLSTTTVMNALEQYKSIRDKIVLEAVPTIETFLSPILDAIKECRKIVIAYHPFNREECLPDMSVSPLCVRLFERRWYLVALNEANETRVYGLDRMKRIDTSDDKFAYPSDFDAEEYFKYDYGIAVGFDEKPCVIRLKVCAAQRPYTRALPLHHSQVERETTEEYSVFEYFIKPNNDFARALLPYGNKIKIIEPKELRDKMAIMALDIFANQIDDSFEENG